jgi:hypothetical protein
MDQAGRQAIHLAYIEASWTDEMKFGFNPQNGKFECGYKSPQACLPIVPIAIGIGIG